MSNKINMTLRIEPELKIQASELFHKLGLDISTAIGIFLRQSLQKGGLPFDVKIKEPNITTYLAMEEAEQMLADPNAKRFSNVEELFKDLNS